MWTLSSHGIILIRIRDFRGEEEVDYYGAHVLLCDQKGGATEYEKNGVKKKSEVPSKRLNFFFLLSL